MIHPSAKIHPTALVADGAVIGEDVVIGPFCIIEGSVEIKARTVLNSHIVVKGDTVIGEDNQIYQFASIGEVNQDLKYKGEATKTIIGNGNLIREHVTIHRGTIQGGGVTRIGNNNLLMINVHVAHDCQIKNNCILANNATLAGHVELDDFVIVGGMSAIHQFVIVGAHVMLGGGSMVSQDVPPYVMAQGNHAQPFGVNLMLMAPNKDELVDIIIEEKPAFVTLGAGNPVPYIKPFQDAGIKVIPVVPSLKLAKRIQDAGADAMIIEGMEAGGHIGTQTTMSLMENILPEISIPVVVAGAIVDGRGLAAALLMGAEGVQMGSRFLLAEECQAHPNMKEAIINATDTDSVVTGLLSGHGGVRGLKNEFTTRYLAAETDGVTTPEERTKMSQGTNKRAAIDGDVVNGAVQVGQGLNRLTAIEPAHTIVQTVMNEAIMSIRKAQRLIEIV